MESPPSSVPAAAARVTVEGTHPCSRHGCGARSGTECAYVDRRGHRCGTAWCPAHADVVGDTVYCPRHGGVVRAIGPEEAAILPDAGNRAPSLVAWVASDVGSGILRLLEAISRPRPELRLVDEPLTRVFFGPERHRIWTRTWKLVAHLGVAYRVDLCVAEERDCEVVVRVNQNDVWRAVPPWIEARRAHQLLGEEADRARRAEFRSQLLDAVAAGLQRSHPLV